MNTSRLSVRWRLCILLAPVLMGVLTCYDFDDPDEVLSIEIEPGIGTVEVGLPLYLHAQAIGIDGSKGEDQDFRWSSSDESVATVERGSLYANATALGISLGTTTITVTLVFDEFMETFTAEMELTVVDVDPVAGVTVTPTTLAGLKDGLMLATVLGVSGSEKAREPVEWASSDPSILAIGVEAPIEAEVAVPVTTAKSDEVTVTTTVRGVPTETTISVLNVTDVRALGDQTCVIGDVAGDSRSFCWGADVNDYEGGAGDASKAVAISEIEAPWDNLYGATGCALVGGTAYCRGPNEFGQAGPGNDVGPVLMWGAVFGNHSWQSLAVAEGHRCGVRAEGDVYCWGANAMGELGLAQADLEWHHPTQISGGGQFSGVSTRGQHSCAYRADVVYCWGSGTKGQNGDGNSVDSNAPVLVDNSLGSGDWTAVATGNEHSCGIRGGEVYCWGANSLGQVGDETAVDRSTPRLVSGQGVDGLVDFKQLSAGANHTCAVTQLSALACWGSGSSGQDASIGTRTKMFRVGDPDSAEEFSVVAAGTSHTCAVATNGAVYCFGENAAGQFGSGAVGEATWVITEAVWP